LVRSVDTKGLNTMQLAFPCFKTDY